MIQVSFGSNFRTLSAFFRKDALIFILGDKTKKTVIFLKFFDKWTITCHIQYFTHSILIQFFLRELTLILTNFIDTTKTTVFKIPNMQILSSKHPNPLYKWSRKQRQENEKKKKNDDEVSCENFLFLSHRYRFSKLLSRKLFFSPFDEIKFKFLITAEK